MFHKTDMVLAHPNYISVFQNIQTVSAAHLASYSLHTGCAVSPPFLYTIVVCTGSITCLGNVFLAVL